MLAVKNPVANAGDARGVGSIPGVGIFPGRGHGNPLQYSCQKESHGPRSLVGYSPLSNKESDTTEQLTTHTNTHIYLAMSDCSCGTQDLLLHMRASLHCGALAQ